MQTLSTPAMLASFITGSTQLSSVAILALSVDIKFITPRFDCPVRKDKAVRRKDF
jgi:hypothetical protein